MERKTPNYDKFKRDMKRAGFKVEEYRGRFHWKGPAVQANQRTGPSLQDVMGATKVPLQWDDMGLGKIVYPTAMEDAW